MASETEIVRAILWKNEFLFRRHLVLSRSVLDQMKASGLITDTTRRKILGAPAPQQVPILLNSLQHTGIHSLKKFMDVLKNTGHGWMVESIMDTDVAAGGQGRSRDDIKYRDRGFTGLGRPRYDPHRTDLRKSVTAGIPPVEGVSLASLFKAREYTDQPEEAPRGVFNARTMLTDPIATGPAQPWQPGPSYGQSIGHLPGLPPYRPQPQPHPQSDSQIPMTLYGLNQAFSNQDQENEQALSVLRQEEIAIRQLAEQNARDQGQLRRKQAAVHDIVHRLQDIHNRAKEVYQPAPRPNIGRYRLAQLNQIPWSMNG